MKSTAQHGFTLVELVIAITVISVAVTGVLGALSSVALRSAQSVVLEQGAAIADAYLQEIIAKPYQDPNVGGETARALFDDIQDYNGLVNVGARDQRDAAITGLDQYTVRISVTPGVLGSLPAADVRRIDINVRHATGVVVNMSAYRSRHP